MPMVTTDTIIAARDPRILLVWYLFFRAGSVVLVNDLPFLLGCFVLVTVTTLLARVAGTCASAFLQWVVFTQTGYLAGGNHFVLAGTPQPSRRFLYLR